MGSHIKHFYNHMRTIQRDATVIGSHAAYQAKEAGDRVLNGSDRLLQ
jgi:hypothetical protein